MQNGRQNWPRELKTYTAGIQKDVDTNLSVGHVPGIPGVHSRENLKEVLDTLAESFEQLKNL